MKWSTRWKRTLAIGVILFEILPWTDSASRLAVLAGVQSAWNRPVFSAGVYALSTLIIEICGSLGMLYLLNGGIEASIFNRFSKFFGRSLPGANLFQYILVALMMGSSLAVLLRGTIYRYDKPHENIGFGLCMALLVAAAAAPVGYAIALGASIVGLKEASVICLIFYGVLILSDHAWARQLKKSVQAEYNAR